MSYSSTPRCAALTKDGTPCGAYAIPGESYCAFHDPARAHSFVEGRRKGGKTPRRVRRLPIILDHMHIAELLSEHLIHAANHPDTFDPRRLQALTAASRALLKTVGAPKDTHLVHYHRGQPLPSQPHLLRVYPPLEPAVAALLDSSAPTASDCPAPEAASPAADHPQEASTASGPEPRSDLPAVFWMAAAEEPGEAQDGAETADAEAVNAGDEVESFDPGRQCDPNADPDLEQRANAGWPRRALLKPDSTLATPLACYDEHGGLDPDRLQRWLQEHPAPPAAPNPAVAPLPECGQRPHPPAVYPALPARTRAVGGPECGRQAAASPVPAGAQPSGQAGEQELDKSRTSAPATEEKTDPEPAPTPVGAPPALAPPPAPRQGDEQERDKAWTSLPGTEKNEAPAPSRTPVEAPSSGSAMSWEDALRTSPYCQGHAEWIIDLLQTHGFAGSGPDP